MKEYFKTDEKLFAFRQKETIGASLPKGKKLRLIGELKFLDKYNTFFRLGDDKYLAVFDSQTEGSVSFYNTDGSHCLAILNLKDNTLSGVSPESSGSLNINFCRFNGRWVPLICYGGINKTFTLKNSSLLEVYNSRLNGNLAGYLGAIYDGAKITGDISQVPLLSVRKQYERYNPFQRYHNPSFYADNRYSNRYTDKNHSFRGGEFTQILDDKTMFIQDGVLYEATIYKDNVIEIKE